MAPSAGVMTRRHQEHAQLHLIFALFHIQPLLGRQSPFWMSTGRLIAKLGVKREGSWSNGA
jgi:hypothetical protein